jgi:hypothetical protein
MEIMGCTLDVLSYLICAWFVRRGVKKMKGEKKDKGNVWSGICDTRSSRD